MSTGSHIRAVGDDETQEQVEVKQADETAGSPDVDLELTDEYLAEPDFDWFEEERPSNWTQWAVPGVAIAVTVAWTGFFGWANSDQMLAGGTAQQWTGWITAWAIPVLLIVSLWLLIMRSSSREANRFGDAAKRLSEESARLEERLAVVNRELSLAREFLGSQTRDLEYLGRTASERISEHADKLQTLIRDNGDQVESIASVSTIAMENMDKLRDDLPVIATSARDVTNQIGNAGRTAKNQLADLIGGFERLNEFGEASERQVTSLRGRVDEALAAFTDQVDHLEKFADARFAKLRDESEAFRTELDGREVVALAAIRGRAEALRKELEEVEAAQEEQRETSMSAFFGRIETMRSSAEDASSGIRKGEEAAIAAWNGQIDEMQRRLQSVIDKIFEIDNKALEASNAKLQDLAAEAESVDTRIGERNALFHNEIAERRARFDEDEEAAIARLEGRLAQFDAQIENRRVAQEARLAEFTETSDALGLRISELGEHVGRLAATGKEAETSLSETVSTLSSALEDSRESLGEADTAISGLTDASVRLLELIQASAKHSKDHLPHAIDNFEESLQDVEQRTEALRAVLLEAKGSGDALTETIANAAGKGSEAAAEIETLTAKIAGSTREQAEALNALSARLSSIGDESKAVAQLAQGELRDAIRELEERGRIALAAIETEQAERIRAIAEKVGEESASAIATAVSDTAASSLGELDAAAERATAASREAATQLRDQLTKVNELAANIETRVARARERAEEQVDNDFSRRVALITESLNSNAIDIGKALSTEVTDTAWTSYLRGDRGIFTRRAVGLLDNTEAREIAELYDVDSEFREHVSRYIHDFEAMLRTLLSTRDGNAMSVTLLGSDMGKLYVALAQALERLRD